MWGADSYTCGCSKSYAGVHCESKQIVFHYYTFDQFWPNYMGKQFRNKQVIILLIIQLFYIFSNALREAMMLRGCFDK